MATYSNSAREVEMPNGDVVVLHSAPTGGANTTSNIKKFKYDDNGHVTESTAANATDLNLNSYSTPTTGSTAIGTSDAVQTAIGKLDHQSQIDQSNILYAIRNGAKNLCKPNLDPAYYNKNGAAIARTYSNGAITIKGTTAAAEAYLSVCEEFTPIYTGDYVFSSASGLIEGKFQMYVAAGSSFVGEPVTAANPARTYSLTAGTTYTLGMVVSANYTIDTTIYPMLCEKTVWDNLNHDFQPPALPNYDLTRLEAEDRAALAEEIDAGAKNKWDFANAERNGTSATTFTKTDTQITVTANNAWAWVAYRIVLPAGTYVWQTKITNCSIASGEARLRVSTQADTQGTSWNTTITGNGTYSVEFTSDGTARYLIYYPNFSSNNNANTFVSSENLVATKAAFGVSNKFVPYRPNYDLMCQSLPYVITKLIATSTDYALISALPIVLTKVGIYRISVFQDYSYTNPRGIIISRSNSDYTESLYVLAKSETSSDVASLSTSCLFYQSTSNVTNLYFWAKAKSVTTNQMGVIIEYLG